MASTYKQPGKVLTLTAPAGGVTAGTPVLIGSIFAVPMITAAAAAEFEGMVEGVHELTKTASQAWAAGIPVFWDVTNARADSTPGVGPRIGVAAAAAASGASLTLGEVKLDGNSINPGPGVYNLRKRFTIAQVNAGATLLPALVGLKYRMISCTAISVGGAATAVTTVDVLGTATSSRKLVAYAQASLTQSAVLKDGGTGATVLADGASYTANDANTAITVGKTGSDVATATHIDININYAIDV